MLEIAAELVGKCIPRDNLVLAACGNQEFDGHRKRLNGFLERMGELGFPDGQIKVIETYNDYHVTLRKVTETLTETPDLAAILYGEPEHPRAAPSGPAA